MEDKSFELMTKMYNEFTQRSDGYKQVYEEVVNVKNTVNELSTKVDSRMSKYV